MTRIPRILTIGLALFLFAVNVYRAATQAITGDEARAYTVFYSRLRNVFQVYDAGNHVLQSVLSNLSVRLFGLSEFSVRVPSLIGAVLFLIAAYRLSVWLFGPGWLSLLAVAVLGLNPFTLDYFSCARGYGLGLGLFFWSFYEIARYAQEADGKRLYTAGIALGLAVGATLIFVYPAAALIALTALLAVLGRRSLWAVIDRMAGPALVVAFVILIVPITRARTEQFYFGAASLGDAVGSLISLSWFHTDRVWALLAFVPGAGRLQPVLPGAAIVAVTAAAIALGMGCVIRLARKREPAAMRRNETALLLSTSTLLITVLFAIALNRAFAIPYPASRTAIYWAPLFTLMAICLNRRGAERAGAAQWTCVGFLAVSVVLFAAGFTTSWYSEWQYDGGSRRIIELLRNQPRAAGRATRVGTSWELEASFNFNRRRYRLDWMEPASREGPNGEFDYYILRPRDRGLIERRGLRIVYTDPESQAIVAAKL